METRTFTALCERAGRWWTIRIPQLEGLTAQEVGAALDREGIAVRAGHHCAQPAVRCFGVENTVRPSLALYNTKGDVDALVDALDRIASARRGP